MQYVALNLIEFPANVGMLTLTLGMLRMFFGSQRMIWAFIKRLGQSAEHMT